MSVYEFTLNGSELVSRNGDTGRVASHTVRRVNGELCLMPGAYAMPVSFLTGVVEHLSDLEKPDDEEAGSEEADSEEADSEEADSEEADSEEADSEEADSEEADSEEDVDAAPEVAEPAVEAFEVEPDPKPTPRSRKRS